MIDQDLLTSLQYATIEPPDGGAAWPSGLWSRDEVLSYLNQRQDKLLKLSLIHVKTSPAIPVLALQRVIDLPIDWAATVSVVWTGDDGQIRELQRTDTFGLDHADATLGRIATASLPLVYMDFDNETLKVEISPGPTGAGNLSVLYVPVGTVLTGNGVSLTVPDELESSVKYGVLADMLGKDGRGRDQARAEYGAQRFQFGVDVARIILEGWA